MWLIWVLTRAPIFTTLTIRTITLCLTSLGADVTEEVGQAYEFGITSLNNKKEYLQVGDSVTFQVEQGGQRATNIKIQRKRHRATVDAFKSECAELNSGVIMVLCVFSLCWADGKEFL